MTFDELSPELQKKVMACSTPEDLLALAKEEGYELTDEELEAVSGGLDYLGPCDEYGCGMVGH